MEFYELCLNTELTIHTFETTVLYPTELSYSFHITKIFRNMDFDQLFTVMYDQHSMRKIIITVTVSFCPCKIKLS